MSYIYNKGKMSQNLKSANLLNFDNSSHKTKYISQFTNKDCGKKSTLESYECNMYITTLNILYNLKHGLGVFDKKNGGDILQNASAGVCGFNYTKHLNMTDNFIKFKQEFCNEDEEIMNIYEYLGIPEPEEKEIEDYIMEKEEEEIEDDISEEVEEDNLSESQDYNSEPEEEEDKLDKLQKQLNDIYKIQKDYNTLLTNTINEVKENSEKVEEVIDNIENDIIPVKNKIKFDIDPTIKKYIKSKDRNFIRELIEKKNEDEIFLRLKNKIYSKYLKMWEDYDIVIRKLENNLYTIDEAPTRGDKNYLDFVCYILNEPHRCNFENEDYVYEY